jgi:hypothetical protein
MRALGYAEKFALPVALATKIRNWDWSFLTYISTGKLKMALGEIFSNNFPLQ